MMSYSKMYNFIEKLKMLGASRVSAGVDDVGDLRCDVEFGNEVVVKDEPLDWRKHENELPDDLFDQMKQEAAEEVSYLSSEGV